VKKIVARYVASSKDEYTHLLERFSELTSKKHRETQQEIGYRTRIIHIGDRLEKLLPNPLDQRNLFEELDSYIRRACP